MKRTQYVTLKNREGATRCMRDPDRPMMVCSGVAPPREIRVLLVEDDEMNRDMLHRRLVRQGFIVLLACDGEQAVASAREHQPDVILMDMSLPLLDGWGATRVLKADESTVKIPVIALTAHAMQPDRERALAAGCDGFETKPINFASLVATLERVCEESTGG